ncbi:MAG TPA: hypothetical protein VIG77_01485 [Ktedonobacterales bacterium]
MSHRAKLLWLLGLEAVMWLAERLLLDNPRGPGGPEFSGPVLGPLVNLVILALLFLPAVLVGMLCRQWQAAIALNVLAVVPAFLLSLAMPYVRPGPLGTGGLNFFVIIAGLGLLGWLLRFVRAEFAA